MSNGPGHAAQDVHCAFRGRFRIDAGTTAAALVLRSETGADARGRTEILFSQVTSHDVPAELEGIVIDTTPDHASVIGVGERRYTLTSGEHRFQVTARSLQIHEPASLYASALVLPRFTLGQRLLWAILLWMARFDWGQALIRRLRAR